MFSTGLLQPKILSAVTQISNLVSTLRTTTRTILQELELSVTQHTPVTQPADLERAVDNCDEQLEPALNAVTDLLESLPPNCSVKDLMRLDEEGSPAISHWLKSFSCDGRIHCKGATSDDVELLADTSLRLANHILSRCHPHRHPLLFSPIVQGTVIRGFKTHRGASSKGRFFARFSSPTVLSEFQQKMVDRFSGNWKLNNETRKFMEKWQSTAEKAAANQDKEKIAFAEGYKVGNEGSKDSLLSRTGSSVWTVVKFFALSCIALYIYQAVKPGSDGIGTSLSSITRDQYEVRPEDVKVRFTDVKGADEAKQELQDVVSYLSDPSKFTSLGARLPKGVLLVGPPGIGKTLLARAVAGEAGVPFFQVSGSEFDEIFVGTGAKRVRQLFHSAKIRAPCVIFIDEIDSVGSKRTNSEIHPYANQTINQLLNEMDGFQQNEGVIVLGATNRKDHLDKALLRPGRFDVEVKVSPPDLKGRKEIIRLYLNKILVDPTVDVDKLAHGTTGFTGADLMNMVNQAALKAAISNSSRVTKEHLDFARDKILMGPAKKTKIPDEKTNWTTAYHEAGHVIVSYYTRNTTPLHKVTIIPRGQSLGHTAYIPDHEIYLNTKADLLSKMDVAMGGRVAEEMIYGADKVTTGAGDDFKQATRIAQAMVKRFGMSEKVGVRVFSEDGTLKDTSPALRELVDSEIKRLLQESYDRASDVLKSHSREHRAIARALMKHETLDARQIVDVIEGRSIV